MKQLADELLYASAVSDAFASLCLRDGRSFDNVLSEIRAQHDFDSSQRLYAVVDNSRLPDFISYAKELELDHRCLLSASIGVEVQHMAAHLVPIPDPKVLRLIFARTWGRKAVLFLQSRKTLRSLATHLREFSLAEKPDGEVSIFRYYDPRVFRAFIENIDRDQYAAVFPGFVERAFFEDERSGLLVAEFPSSGAKAISIRQC